MIEKKVFENFNKVVCINLHHRTDRKINFLSQCNIYNLGEFDFFTAINGNDLTNTHPISNGNFGLIMSNIEILKKAKEDNLKNILIIEDDCIFNDNIKNIKPYLDALPNDWDMFYLGGNHNIGWNGITEPVIINDKIVKLHNTYTTHFVLINSNMFDILINELSKFLHPIDVTYSMIQKKYNVYCTKNTIATQQEGYSDIENKMVNYLNIR